MITKLKHTQQKNAKWYLCLETHGINTTPHPSYPFSFLVWLCFFTGVLPSPAIRPSLSPHPYASTLLHSAGCVLAFEFDSFLHLCHKNCGIKKARKKTLRASKKEKKNAKNDSSVFYGVLLDCISPPSFSFLFSCAASAITQSPRLPHPFLSLPWACVVVNPFVCVYLRKHNIYTLYSPFEQTREKISNRERRGG